MSEIAIISTREVIYEPSLQKSGKIKVTSNVSQNAGMWNLQIRYFGTYPKTDTMEVQVQTGVNEETNEPVLNEDGTPKTSPLLVNSHSYLLWLLNNNKVGFLQLLSTYLLELLQNEDFKYKLDKLM